MCNELMREFYDEEKVYRITNELGQKEYAVFSGDMLSGKAKEYDSLGFETGTKYRRIDFDISIVPQRQNSYKREANNQTIVQLWEMGIFSGQNIDLAITALKAMNFDGRDGIISSLNEIKEAQKAAMQSGVPAM